MAMNLAMPVANTGSPITEDVTVRNRLVSTLGHSVTYVDDGVSSGMDAYDAVIEGPSSVGTDMAANAAYWKALAVPLFLRQQWQIVGMCASLPLFNGGQDLIRVEMAAHALAGGLSAGNHEFAITGNPGYVASTSNADVIAGADIVFGDTSSARAAGIWVPAGVSLSGGGTSPAVRVGWGLLWSGAVADANEAVFWTLFDAAIAEIEASLTPAWTTIDTVGSGTLTYLDETVVAGLTYEYEIEAVNAFGETLSNTEQFTLVAGMIKRFNGSAFASAEVKRFNGSAFVNQVIQRKTASGWQNVS